MRRRTRGPRPERVLGPASGTVFLLLIWEAVAHASGSGWVQGLATLAAGIAVVGFVGPGLAARRIQVEVTASPTDATAGEPFRITVVATRPCRCAPSRPEGSKVVARPGSEVELEVTPDRRGVLSQVDVLVETAAPLGMLWWSVPRRLELPRAVLIAPRTDAGRATVEGADGDAGRSPRARVAETGDLRGVREYRIGDSPRVVHWRASAHTNTLMVRESEEHQAPAVSVDAILPDDLEEAEREAEAAFGTVKDLLRGGHRVVLVTNEAGAIREGPVPDELSAGRRLARAGRNPWAA